MNPKITTTCAIALAALVGAAAPALGHGSGGTGDGMPAWLAEADSDGDGKLSRAEHYEHRKARFATFDADSDGTLNAEELGAMIEEMRKHRYERMLARMDSDGDGSVTAEEFARAEPHRGMMHGDKRGHHGDGHGPRHGGWFGWFRN